MQATGHRIPDIGFFAFVFFMAAWIGTPRFAQAQTEFHRGDSNDDKAVDLSDAVYTLFYLFVGDRTPRCLAVADANDDWVVDISDPVYTLEFLFTGGPKLPDDPPACSLSRQCVCGEYYFVGMQVQFGAPGDDQMFKEGSYASTIDYLDNGDIQWDMIGYTMEWNGTFDQIFLKEGPGSHPFVKYAFYPNGSGMMWDAMGDVTRSWRSDDFQSVGSILDFEVDEHDFGDTGRGFGFSVAKPADLQPGAVLGTYRLIGRQARFLLQEGEKRVSVRTRKGALTLAGGGSASGGFDDDWISGKLPCLADCPVKSSEHVSFDGSSYTISQTGELKVSAPGGGALDLQVGEAGEIAIGLENSDSSSIGAQDSRRGFIFGLKQGSGMDAGEVKGNYQLLGLQTQLQSGTIVEESFQGTISFNGTGNACGEVKGNQMRYSSCFGQRSVQPDDSSWDGSTYTVSASGDLEITRPGGKVKLGLVSAGGGVIALFADFDEECDDGRGFLIGFRLPSEPPADVIAFFHDEPQDNLTVIGMAVPGAATYQDYKLFKSYDGANFVQETFLDNQFLLIDNAFGITTQTDRDTWYKVKAVVCGFETDFSNTVSLPYNARGPLSGLQVIGPSPDACVDLKPTIDWAYLGHQTIGSYLIFVERHLGPGKWENYAFVRIQGPPWVYGDRVDVPSIMKSLDPGYCYSFGVGALDPQGIFMGFMSLQNIPFRTQTCPATCP